MTMTIKHITISGYEYLFEAANVQFIPENVQPLPKGSTPARVVFHPAGVIADDQPIALTGGTVFVMNSFGKTVSRYELGDSVRYDVEKSYAEIKERIYSDGSKAEETVPTQARYG